MGIKGTGSQSQALIGEYKGPFEMSATCFLLSFPQTLCLQGSRAHSFWSTIRIYFGPLSLFLGQKLRGIEFLSFFGFFFLSFNSWFCHSLRREVGPLYAVCAPQNEYQMMVPRPQTALKTQANIAPMPFGVHPRRIGYGPATSLVRDASRP